MDIDISCWVTHACATPLVSKFSLMSILNLLSRSSQLLLLVLLPAITKKISSIVFVTALQILTRDLPSQTPLQLLKQVQLLQSFLNIHVL